MLIGCAKVIEQLCFLPMTINAWKLTICSKMHSSPVVSLIHYIGNRVMVLSIRFFDGFVFWVGK